MSNLKNRANADNRLNFCFTSQDLQMMIDRDKQKSSLGSFVLGLLASASVVTAIFLMI